MMSANKRSVPTLFSTKTDIYSHQVRIVLAEKGVAYEIENILPGTISEDLIEVNPRGTVPVLVDRDLILSNARIIMEYLDERFPHPPLMPVYPILRAQCRLNIHRIQNDWFSLIDFIERDPTTAEAQRALNQLREEVLALGPVFSDSDYFLSEDFSLVDCYVAPLLWRMNTLGVEFNGAGSKAVKAYMNRVFKRDSFVQSIGGSTPQNLMDDKD
ncbi:glutathione S-transferase N-terminal domain-containing protein [Glaesserella parasuis]|uniref:Glutathione S-transferase N-terminal domain-containing protein n=1 Tax=Glaesserella parasuis TaxID=738 RepID=A0A6L7AY73_GLAPU|nr:glutathione S-transferase N-terminal domain-containing protein [Glaesserella parasuis]MDD2167342.1 glutathione S-transferase N-terminal domain-containing protein [Glaesserella parasuis]MDG6231477.1 glutathione S-transferase N-terminal domain-containing protein [Glaesserella parasuis]MDG6342211.1 glutathione S-transferase N-terminal domain-containing protein [Glaesserella parasuis]MDG6346451.1 glutathione S-transferase N-terminal domain-containing protein [Glaesserella parasuis]MDG6368344.1 